MKVDEVAAVVELFAECDVVVVQCGDDGGCGVELPAELVRVVGLVREFAAELGGLVGVAGLVCGEAIAFGDLGVPLGHDLGCAVHRGAADFGFLPEVLLDQPPVGVVGLARQKSFHCLS